MEGATLVIDTTNFDDGGGFYGDAGGNFGWDRNLHVIERLRFFDADTLLYQFEIDNPTAFTQPWKGELTMARSNERIYEFACHEANYSLTNMLRGYPRRRTKAALVSRPPGHSGLLQRIGRLDAGSAVVASGLA